MHVATKLSTVKLITNLWFDSFNPRVPSLVSQLQNLYTVLSARTNEDYQCFCRDFVTAFTALTRCSRQKHRLCLPLGVQ